MKNIALVGPMKCGKDTIASFFIQNLGYKRIAFADAMKKEVCEILNNYPTSPNTKPWTPESIDKHKDFFRPLLQWWGQYRRSEDPDYWVRIVSNQLNIADKHVVTDPRYINELEFLQKNNFFIVRIKPKKELQVSENELNHISEQQWKEFTPDLTKVNGYGLLPNLVKDLAIRSGIKMSVKRKANLFYKDYNKSSS